MNTSKRIMNILSKRKTGMTSFDISTRLGDVKPKTVRNNLGKLVASGDVKIDDYQYLREDRYVNAYRAA